MIVGIPSSDTGIDHGMTTMIATRIPTPFPHLESRSPRPTRRPEHKGNTGSSVSGYLQHDWIAL
jgi:hypothetical protein